MTAVKMRLFEDSAAHFVLVHKINQFVRHNALSTSVTSQTPKLLITPNPTLMDQRISVCATGLPSNAEVTLAMKLNNSQEKLNFASVGHYITEKDGTLDLNVSKQLLEPFTGIDPMYLFWSMTPQSKDALERYFVRDITQTQVFNFRLCSGHIGLQEVFPRNESNGKDGAPPLAEVNCHREYISKNVKRVVVDENGIYACVFLPSHSTKKPLVIILSGGIHRGTLVEEKAALLADKGFATAVIGYFGVGSLPKRYGDLDIEYFEDAINLICSKFSENIDKDKVGIMGFSKGGDISLGCVAFLPHIIKSAVLLNCSVSSIVFKLRYKGEVIDGLQIDPTKAELLTPTNGVLDLLGLMSKVKDNPSTVVPFVRSPADLLWIAGDDDHNFESSEYAQMAADMCSAHGKTNFEYEIFHGLGHLIDLPYSPPATSSLHPLAPGLTLYMGGAEKRKHVHAQIKVWQKTIDFFKRTLVT